MMTIRTCLGCSGDGHALEVYLEDLWALFYLEVQVNPSLQVAPEDQVALEAPETPLVLKEMQT